MISKFNISGFEEGGFSETEWALIQANEEGLSVEETMEKTGISRRQIKKVSAYLGLDWGILTINKKRFIKEWESITAFFRNL